LYSWAAVSYSALANFVSAFLIVEVQDAKKAIRQIANRVCFIIVIAKCIIGLSVIAG
jgi:hypothetical protein